MRSEVLNLNFLCEKDGKLVAICFEEINYPKYRVDKRCEQHITFRRDDELLKKLNKNKMSEKVGMLMGLTKDVDAYCVVGHPLAKVRGT